MKIAVYGFGAIGALTSMRLAATGCAVHLSSSCR